MSVTNRPGDESGNCHGTLTGLMEQVVSKENISRAYYQVLGNKGSAGVDGLGVHEMKSYLAVHWEKMKWNSGASHMNKAYPKYVFDQMGLVSLFDSWQRHHPLINSVNRRDT